MSEVSGKKSWKDKIEEGRAWKKDLLAKGYQETPDGLLPMSEVNKAGYVLKDNQWFIPKEEYIADGNYDRKAGEKYIGASQQYLHWRQQRQIADSNRISNPQDKQLKMIKEVVKSPPILNDEIDISKIPF